MGTEKLPECEFIMKKNHESFKEPIKSKQDKIKQNLENETNVETPPNELNKFVMEVNQETEERVHQSELQITINNKVDQSRDNKKQQIVISKEQINENIPRTNDEKKSLERQLILNKFLTGLKQRQKQEKIEKIQQSELQIANNNEAEENIKPKIIINESISEEKNNENIPRNNDEKKSSETTTKMNEGIESYIKFKEWHQQTREKIVSNIEKNKKTVKESNLLKFVETKGTSKEEKKSEKKMIKLKEKMAMKQKPTLDIISQILYESRPVFIEKQSRFSTFNEIIFFSLFFSS